MGRSQRLVLAVLGLVGLVGWCAYVLALDTQLMHRLQDAVLIRPGIFWALRLGLLPAAVALACVALVQTIRNRSVRGWFIAALLVLLAPLVLKGLPLRLTLLPYYLLSALYLVLALSAHNPGRKA